MELTPPAFFHKLYGHGWQTKVAAALGGILLPLLMSLIAKTVSFQTSLLVFPLALVLAFLILLPEMRRLGSTETAPAVEPAD